MGLFFYESFAFLHPLGPIWFINSIWNQSTINQLRLNSKLANAYYINLLHPFWFIQTHFISILKNLSFYSKLMIFKKRSQIGNNNIGVFEGDLGKFNVWIIIIIIPLGGGKRAADSRRSDCCFSFIFLLFLVLENWIELQPENTLSSMEFILLSSLLFFYLLLFILWLCLLLFYSHLNLANSNRDI